MRENTKLDRSIGLWAALALVVGTIIGAGVFIRQATVLDEAGSPILALLAWLLGGVITLTAGLTISEISSQMPHTGGLFVYMNRLYGELWGFLSGWMQVIVYGPAMIASLGAYLGILIASFFRINTRWEIPIGIFAVCVIGVLNFFSNKYGARFAIITTLCKLVPVTALILLGLTVGDDRAFMNSTVSFTHTQGNFGVAILATLFAFDGWILVANLGGEIKNAKKRLPQAIIYGISLVIIIYLLIAWSTFQNLSAKQIHSLGSGVIPYIAMTKFGSIGGKILSIGIIISIVGCMNGKIMAFPRIMYAMAQKRQLPFANKLSYLHKNAKTPIVSISVVVFISCLMIAFTDADRLSELCIFTVYCFYVLTFLGLFKLRKSEGLTKVDHFRVPLYPLTPIIALGGSLYVILSEVVNDPVGATISLLIVATGVPVYFWSKSRYKNIEGIDIEEN